MGFSPTADRLKTVKTVTATTNKPLVRARDDTGQYCQHGENGEVGIEVRTGESDDGSTAAAPIETPRARATVSSGSRGAVVRLRGDTCRCHPGAVRRFNRCAGPSPDCRCHRQSQTASSVARRRVQDIVDGMVAERNVA